MKILKFGGTSVGSPETIQGLVAILKTYYSRGEKFAVVFSAFSKITDSLLETAKKASAGEIAYEAGLDHIITRHEKAVVQLLSPANQDAVFPALGRNMQELRDVLHGVYLLREASARSLDLIAGMGERCSALIIAAVMNQEGIPTEFLDARTVVRTDNHFGSARVDFDETNALIKAHFERHPSVQSITGFIGSTVNGLSTTLGRGGSDYTAAIFGAALNASAIEIWTDVDGVLTADPRRVAKAFSLPRMTYKEAMEMSHFGAKVIYPPTILPALAKGIPLYIKNTFNPTFEGTCISHDPGEQQMPIKGISSINSVCLITLQGSALFGVPGISARLFGALARAGANVVLITQGSSESSITFAVSPAQAELAKKAVETEYLFELREGTVDPLKIEGDLSVIAVVGEQMRYTPGIAGRLFNALGKNGVNIVAIAQGSSELNISTVVPAADETKALNAIHEAFFLSDTKTLHLYVVGIGLIGRTLLNQIAKQAPYLKSTRKLEIKIVGLANSKRMVLDAQGIDFADPEAILSEKGAEFSLHEFVETMKRFNLSNSVFLDNTASEAVTAFYEQILDASISISTPNKLAASGSYLHYRRLKQIAAKRGVQWRYETNVGAGLPIINTLNDLIQSGDQILRIEGILSGTLAYIFNNFKENTRFSSIVAEAKALGLTEPDPRDDLSGSDVRRKLLILAREAGLALEAKDIQLESILPAACAQAADAQTFMTELPLHDGHFESLRAAAAADGKVLRMVASLHGQEAKIGLQAFGPEHPFYFLSGSDNMVVFTTERYRERPLVVRGPGAGAEVTAAGVFAEVIGLMG